MDGNYANRLNAIIFNQSLALNSYQDKKTTMDEVDKTLKKTGLLAMMYKFENWEVGRKELCSFDVYYHKLSTGD